MSNILHSKVLGTGRPLLILHGFLGMLDNWKTLGESYAEKGFQVHLVDLRNHGRSFHTEDFSYALMCRDIEAYLEHNHIDKVSIIGHSMGGKLAMYFAIKNTETVQTLIVADIAPKYYAPHHQQILKALNGLDFEKISSRLQAEEALRVYLQDESIVQFLLKSLYRNPENTYGLRFNLKSLTQNIDAIGEALPKDGLFLGKTLFLRGQKSDYILDSDTESIKEHFPQAIIQTIAEAGHWLHADNPQDFLQKTIDFLCPNLASTTKN